MKDFWAIPATIGVVVLVSCLIGIPVMCWDAAENVQTGPYKVLAASVNAEKDGSGAFPRALLDFPDGPRLVFVHSVQTKHVKAGQMRYVVRQEGKMTTGSYWLGDLAEK